MEELNVKVGDKVLVSGRYKEDDYIAYSGSRKGNAYR